MSTVIRSLIVLVCAMSIPGRCMSQDLPVSMTPAEQSIMTQYLQVVSPAAFSITTPPASHVRTMAEWEEIDGLMITWTSYPAILKDIVKYAQLETRVWIVCSDSATVKNYLTTNGVTITNVGFVIAPFNSVWARDYGQWNAYTNDVDSLLLVDWIYNRPRPSDDTVPSAIAQVTGLPIYSTTVAPNDLVHTGGNFMVDGFGTAFSSKLIQQENPGKTVAQIDTIMSQFMGVNRYVMMETLPYDGIHHIDMHIKLLDEETLLVGQFPAGTSDGPQLEANLQYLLNNYPTKYGRPYRVFRVPMPASAGNTYPPNADYRTFTNSVIVNKTVLVPTYTQQYDTTALRVYREAMPGYNIVPINVESMISASGALHCITKEIGNSDPLLISHAAWRDTTFTGAYNVQAYINHRSGIASATLYYRTDTTQPYSSVAMSAMAQPNQWMGQIPAQVAGTRVYYYISAASVSGKTQKRPMPAPVAYWSFKVLPTVNVETVEQSLQVPDVFPNPSKGITCIPVVSNNAANASINVTDVLGREVVKVYSGRMPQGESHYFFNTATWPAGMYMVNIRCGNELISRKVTVR